MSEWGMEKKEMSDVIVAAVEEKLFILKVSLCLAHVCYTRRPLLSVNKMKEMIRPASWSGSGYSSRVRCYSSCCRPGSLLIIACCKRNRRVHPVELQMFERTDRSSYVLECWTSYSCDGILLTSTPFEVLHTTTWTNTSNSKTFPASKSIHSY